MSNVERLRVAAAASFPLPPGASANRLLCQVDDCSRFLIMPIAQLVAPQKNKILHQILSVRFYAHRQYLHQQFVTSGVEYTHSRGASSTSVESKSAEFYVNRGV